MAERGVDVGSDVSTAINDETSSDTTAVRVETSARIAGGMGETALRNSTLVLGASSTSSTLAADDHSMRSRCCQTPNTPAIVASTGGLEDSPLAVDDGASTVNHMSSSVGVAMVAATAASLEESGVS